MNFHPNFNKPCDFCFLIVLINKQIDDFEMFNPFFLKNYDFSCSQIYEWTGVTVSSQFSNNNYKETEQCNESQSSLSSTKGLPLVRTGQINHYLQTLEIWLREKNEQHFLIYGPNGSAKTYVLIKILSVLHCF